MKKNKKIDEIYRSKLEGVETTPPEGVWQHIDQYLSEKEPKKRILPLWLVGSGSAAAILLLFFFLGFPWKEEVRTYNPTISTPEERKFKLDLTSDTFEEIMSRSSIVLEAALKGSEKIPIKAGPATQDQREESGALAEATKLEENPKRKRSDQGFSQPDVLDDEESVEFSIASSPEYAATEDEGADSQKENTEKNTTVLASEKEIGGAIAEADEKEGSEGGSKRFSVTTTAAAVYHDKLGGRNTLDNQVANQESSGEVSMAYGIQLAYQVSDKVKLRTGVSKFSYNYSIRNAGSTFALNSGNTEAGAEILLSPSGGRLNQNLGFIEVPLEIEYALINKKFGLNLIGGASTLFLEENSLSLNSAYSTTQLGEAKNLNNLSFSTNLGVGLDYSITPEFELSLEPIFKYQLNTFKNSSDFKPYNFGIYSGLRYRF